MILDKLSHAHRYASLHPLFAEGFDFLRIAKAQPFIPGRYEIHGKELMAIVEENLGRTRQEARLETHRKYIDIQFVYSGLETIGWKDYHQCTSIQSEYNAERDIEFYSDVPECWFPVMPHAFAIFFPEDAHAPLAGEGSVRKIILKVAVN